MNLHSLRPAIATRRGLVVAGNAESAQAGAEVLRAGGNAMDAAIATSAALAVTIPYMNGLGGDGFGLWYDRRSRRVHAINGSGAAPAQATIERYVADGLAEVPVRGPYAISVPGLAHAWHVAAGRFGTKPFATLLAPAIALAQGTPLGRQFADFCNSALFAAQCRDHPPLAALFGPAGGRHVGEIVRQPALAQTLSAIAQHGPQMLYGGATGSALVDDVRAQGGLLATSDLAQHRTRVEEPLELPWMGGTLFTSPPNSQGMVLSLLIALLRAAGVAPDDPAFPVTFLRAKKIAFEERDRLLGDPDAAALPADLLASERIAALWRTGGRMPAVQGRAGTGDTTCLVAMDEAGNAVSWVQSLFDEFGSLVCSPQTGIILQNRLCLASLRPGLPSSLRPGFRPPHTLCPALFTSDGRCRIAIATPGGHGQAQALALVLLNILARGQDVQAAIEAPRFCQEYDAEVLYESRIDPSALAALVAGGYTTTDVGPWSRDAGLTNAIGAVVAIDAARDDLRAGGADPRRDCYAVAQ